MIREGQTHGRLDPRQGLIIEDGRGRRVVPIEFHDFAWSPSDFQQWIIVGNYSHRSISEPKTSAGVGVPLVMVRRKPAGAGHESDFLPPEATFAATAILEPAGSALALHNPLRAASVSMDGEPSAAGPRSHREHRMGAAPSRAVAARGIFEAVWPGRSGPFVFHRALSAAQDSGDLCSRPLIES